MHYLSDSEPDAPNSSQRDLKRLQAAWNHVKQKRQSEKKSVGSVRNAINQQQQHNLQARLSMTEKQLGKARQNTALLMKKLSEAEEEIQMKHFQIAQERKLREQREEEIESLKLLLAKRNTEAKEETFGLNKQNFSDNIITENLRKNLQMKEKQIDRLCLKIKSLELDKHNHGSEIQNLQSLNENYRRQLMETQNAINQAYLGQSSKGAHLLELDQAKKTIERLVYLLRTTEQYRNFTEFSDDAKQLHFLKNIPKRLKTNMLNHKIPQRKKLCTCMDIKIDQKLLWTPEASYKILLSMKIKYDSLTEQCIQEVLFQLNKIWLARQEVHVKRVKQSYEAQLNRLKKKSEQRYDQIVARKQIQRLKKELTGAKSCCGPSKNSSYDRKCSNKGAALLDNLKNVGQYEDEIRIRNKEIKLLQERIRLLETEADCSDRVLYLQGALWVIDKVLKQLEGNDEDMREFEGQFRNRIEGNLSNQQWIRAFKEFFETITQINNALFQRLFAMRDSTLKKVSGEKTANIVNISKKQ